MKILITEICAGFELEAVNGAQCGYIDNVGSTKRFDQHSLQWAKNDTYLAQVSQGAVICRDTDFAKISPVESVCYLVTSKSPRLLFAKVVSHYFAPSIDDEFVNCVAEHRNNHSIKIAENVFIGKHVQIGPGTIIHPGAVIYANTVIGHNCVIKAHVSIGTEGLGLEMDAETNTFFKFPQIGGVVIHDNVEIGPTATIRKSALDNTIIGRGTKIGALVNIGHNCIIGQNCILACQNVMSGSSIIGDNVFLGVGAVLKQSVKVGDGVTIGQGAVVTKHVPAGETWVGNPAKLLPPRP
jgi:UDP-3-O-[3-hydroxymyristoyl] glucosamine N-acyltransferase